MLEKIKTSRKKVEEFLLSVMEDGYFDTSKYNKGIEEGMFLPATYNAVNALGLMGRLDVLDKPKFIHFLKSHKSIEDTFYKIKGMKLEDISYPTFEYDDLHITNYCMAALDYLGYTFTKEDLTFLNQYNDLSKWLSNRNMQQPWTEGNYIVNLASFFFEKDRINQKSIGTEIEKMLSWHYENQDKYGFFHDTDIRDLTNAFAGATHNYHIFYYLNKPIPMYKQVVDYMLSRPTAIDCACIDVDELDILFHFIKYGYKVDEIKNWTEKKLRAILDFQNDDGGFADAKAGTGDRLFDGWNRYKEPQGLSNCFATWFRLLAIAMADMILHDEPLQWNFRRTIGIGYANKAYLNSGFDQNELQNFEEKVLKRAASKDTQSTQNSFGENLDNEKILDIVESLNQKFGANVRSAYSFSGVFQFVIKDEGMFFISICPDHATVFPGENDESNTTLILDRSTFIAMANKKLNSKLAYLTGKLKIQGDISLATKLGAIF